MADGQLAPEIAHPLAGDVTQRWVALLANTECPALTARRARRAERTGASQDPIVWERAVGVNVYDAEGNRYVDMSAAFGVAALGHSPPNVVAAAERQMKELTHGFGDVHPSIAKLEFLGRLAELAPFEEARVVLGLNGSDAIAAALKTAVLHTSRSGVLAFEGGYHGLMYAPLSVCGYRSGFREPFVAQLNPLVRFAPYPTHESVLRSALRELDALWTRDIGAIVIEPIQVRGGIRMPVEALWPELKRRCIERGAVLIVDEIFTNFGRTGVRWAHAQNVAADIVCAGKAIGGGFPLSACIGAEPVMRAWGQPDQEPIHTATFAGHPVSCAAGRVTLDEIEGRDLAGRAAQMGERWLHDLRETFRRSKHVVDVRGSGFTLGVELRESSRLLEVVRALLERGYIVLPSGDATISLTPPLTIERDLLDGFTATLEQVLAQQS